MSRAITVLIGALLALFIATIAAAEPLAVSAADIREPPPGMDMTAAYALLENPTASDIVIQSASSDRFQRIEFHRSEVVDGVARMAPQATLTVPAGGRLSLAPGGYHFMLLGIRDTLDSGDSVTITLHSEQGDSTAIFVVRRY